MGNPKRVTKARSRSSAQNMGGAGASMILLMLIVVGGIGVGSYYGGQALGWWGASPEVPITTPTTTGSFTFYFYDPGTNAEYEDSAILECNIYESPDTDDYTTAQKELWTTSSYTRVTGRDSGESYDYETDHLYYCFVNGSDIVPKYFIPTDGLNSIPIYNFTEDVALAMESKNELSTTFNQTNYYKWTMRTQTLDGTEGTGEATDYEGFMPYCDFTQEGNDFRESPDNNVNLVLRIKFNTTAQLSFIDYDPDHLYTEHDVTPVISGVYAYFVIDNVALLGSNAFEFELSTGLGSTFEVIEGAVGYNTAASMTVWDTAN